MPTPGSGAISMNNMNTEILRAGGTATVSMDTIRTRYGGSGAIAFSDLRNAEGFTLNPARYYAEGKASQNTDGWSDGFVIQGSISPDEVAGRLQFAANSFLYEVIEDNLVAGGSTFLRLAENDTVAFANGDAVTAGFKGTNVSRVVLANTSRSITEANSTGAYGSYAKVTYDMPTSGTIHCLIKF